MHIDELHAETEEPKTEHQIMITWFCCSLSGSLPGYYLILREEKRMNRGR